MSSVAVVAVLAVALTIAPSVPARAAGWRDLLELAADAGRGRSFEGRMVVVSFEGVPTIGVVEVTQDEQGLVVADDARSWVLGRVEGQGFFGDSDAGTLLRLGSVGRGTFSLDRLLEKYEVDIAGREQGVVGDAVIVTLHERASRKLRERLYIDESSGVVVRRETYDGRDEPVRLVEFTRLDLRAVDLPEVDDGMAEVHTDRATLAEHEVDILRDIGWSVPRELPGGFHLTDADVIDEGGTSNLRLHYSDGLYTISVFEQHGLPDVAAMEQHGARVVPLAGTPAWRYPGAQPATYVWGAEDVTFTTVTDAPRDVVATAVAALPHDPPPSALERIRRGLTRAVRWAWPFD